MDTGTIRSRIPNPPLSVPTPVLRGIVSGYVGKVFRNSGPPSSKVQVSVFFRGGSGCGRSSVVRRWEGTLCRADRGHDARVTGDTHGLVWRNVWVRCVSRPRGMGVRWTGHTFMGAHLYTCAHPTCM